MQTIIHKSAIEQTRGFALFLRCWWMKATDIPVGLRQSVTLLVRKLHSPINACILRILPWKFVNFDMQIKVEAKDLL